MFSSNSKRICFSLVFVIASNEDCLLKREIELLLGFDGCLFCFFTNGLLILEVDVISYYAFSIGGTFSEKQERDTINFNIIRMAFFQNHKFFHGTIK